MLTWLEDGGCTETADESLGEQNLPIFGRQRSHHDTKDVKNTTNQEEPPGPILVVDDANKGALQRSASEDGKRRIKYQTYHSHHQKDLDADNP
jgi:hypothetical protein